MDTISMWREQLNEAETMSDLAMIADDIILAVDADFEVWRRKIDNASNATQMRIICDDLLALLDSAEEAGDE